MSTDSDDAPPRAKHQPTGDYETGYCRPPKGGQFKKGQPSRNPKGRPRRSKRPHAIVEETSGALVSFPHNGKMIKVTCFEAMIRGLYAKAFKGCRKAQADLLSMRLKYARKRQTHPDDDDVVYEFTLKTYDQQQEEDGPKQARKREPRSSMRSRKNETRPETFNRVAALMVPVNDSGVRKRITFESALWKMIFASALAGDIAAVRLITRFMDAISECESQYPQKDADDDTEVYTLNLGTLINDNAKEDGEGDDPESAP